MSKYVKNLVTEHLRQRLQGVDAALLVSLVGMDANTNARLRRELEQRRIELVMVKNSLAGRAVSGTPLEGMFEGIEGSAAVCFGSEDIVSLAKEVTRLAGDKRFAPFTPCGGMMDGERLSAEQVQQVSKWPGRAEQLALLVGQILSPGANLASQLLGPGGEVASQISQKGEGEEGGEPVAEAPAAAS